MTLAKEGWREKMVGQGVVFGSRTAPMTSSPFLHVVPRIHSHFRIHHAHCTRPKNLDFPKKTRLVQSTW